MDLALINRLPTISRPRYIPFIIILSLFRKGLLEKIEKSREKLSEHEIRTSQEAFQLFDIDKSSNIIISLSHIMNRLDQLRRTQSIVSFCLNHLYGNRFMHLNLKMEDDVYEDYLNKFFELNRPLAMDQL